MDDSTVSNYSLRFMNNALRQLNVLIVFVRRISLLLMLIGVATIFYAIGQWIDNDNLLFDLTVKPFWIYHLRECNA